MNELEILVKHADNEELQDIYRWKVEALDLRIHKKKELEKEIDHYKEQIRIVEAELNKRSAENVSEEG